MLIEISFQLSFLISLKFFFYTSFLGEIFKRFKEICSIDWETEKEMEYTTDKIVNGLEAMVDECEDFLNELEQDQEEEDNKNDAHSSKSD
jgi:hypothetical protein